MKREEKITRSKLMKLIVFSVKHLPFSSSLTLYLLTEINVPNTTTRALKT